MWNVETVSGKKKEKKKTNKEKNILPAYISLDLEAKSQIKDKPCFFCFFKIHKFGKKRMSYSKSGQYYFKEVMRNEKSKYDHGVLEFSENHPNVSNMLQSPNSW